MIYADAENQRPPQARGGIDWRVGPCAMVVPRRAANFSRGPSLTPRPAGLALARAERAVEAFDVAVMNGLAGHDVVDGDASNLPARVEALRRTLVGCDGRGHAVLEMNASSAPLSYPAQKN